MESESFRLTVRISPSTETVSKTEGLAARNRRFMTNQPGMQSSRTTTAVMTETRTRFLCRTFFTFFIRWTFSFSASSFFPFSARGLSSSLWNSSWQASQVCRCSSTRAFVSGEHTLSWYRGSRS